MDKYIIGILIFMVHKTKEILKKNEISPYVYKHNDNERTLST